MGDAELGARLKQAREHAKLKQADVCDAVNIPKVQTLSAYERGVNSPPLETLKKLARLYKVSADWLLFGENNIPQKDKTPLDYVTQLVDAVEYLGIPFDSWEDTFTHENVIVLRLLSSPYVEMDSFIEKWRRLRDLLDSKIIELDEYEGLIRQKLSALVLTEKSLDRKFAASSTETDILPF